MPTYEYHCDGCNRDFEVRQRISEAPLTTCDACGGSIRRLISPAPFILKGEGWYVTDYPSASRKKAMESEKGAGGDKGSGDKGAGDKAAVSSTKGGETSGAADKPAPTTTSSSSGSTSAGSPPD